MQSASSDELARKLDDTITFAVAIAQRNYKFIVPIYYTPETILLLDAVYQNARLIAKPDDTWLYPDTIL